MSLRRRAGVRAGFVEGMVAEAEGVGVDGVGGEGVASGGFGDGGAAAGGEGDGVGVVAGDVGVEEVAPVRAARSLGRWR